MLTGLRLQWLPRIANASCSGSLVSKEDICFFGSLLFFQKTSHAKAEEGENKRDAFYETKILSHACEAEVTLVWINLTS